MEEKRVETSLILFLAAFVFLVCLVLTEGVHLFLSLLFFSLTTSCMMGVNMMLVSFVPTNFIRWGRVSTISGLLNSHCLYRKQHRHLRPGRCGGSLRLAGADPFLKRGLPGRRGFLPAGVAGVEKVS